MKMISSFTQPSCSKFEWVSFFCVLTSDCSPFTSLIYCIYIYNSDFISHNCSLYHANLILYFTIAHLYSAILSELRDKTLQFPFSFYSVAKTSVHIMRINSWLPTLFKIYVFVFNRRKKLIHVWNNLMFRQRWQHFHFLVHCPFKRHAFSHSLAHLIL